MRFLISSWPNSKLFSLLVVCQVSFQGETYLKNSLSLALKDIREVAYTLSPSAMYTLQCSATKEVKKSEVVQPSIMTNIFLEVDGPESLDVAAKKMRERVSYGFI